MIYDGVESSSADLTANFTTYFAAVVASKTGIPGGAGAINTTVTIYKRLPAEIFLALATATLPGLGVYAMPGPYPGQSTARTQAKSVQQRRSIVTLAWDYCFRGPDPALAVIQGELAVEAILKHVDVLFSQPGVVGAGEAELSVTVDLFDVKGAGEDYYEQRAVVTAPIDAWDTGL